MPTLEEEQQKDFERRLGESSKEREAEWEEVRKRFPINPNDTPEKQKEMYLQQQAAMLDA